jgi:hypothetical protein
LGEFVEGKERLKMVIHKEYKGTKEILSLFQTSIDTGDEEMYDFADEALFEDLAADEGIEHDIMSLGEMERKMVKEDEGDEEDTPTSDTDLDQKPAAVDNPPSGKGNVLGHTEEDAIALSSDDESGDEKEKEISSTAGGGTSNSTENAPIEALQQTQIVDPPLTDCQFYRIFFPGPSIGVNISLYKGRFVVSQIGRDRLRRLGPTSKPAVGDVFVQVGRMALPARLPLDSFQSILRHYLANPPTPVVFAEVPEVQEYFREASEQQKLMPTSGTSEIIEIDDSDEE